MGVALDASVFITLGIDPKKATETDKRQYETVSRIIERESQCYAVPAAVVEAYTTIYEYGSHEVADYVLDMILRSESSPIRISEDRALIELAIEVAKIGGLPMAVSFTAALARHRGMPVITNDHIYEELQKHGICRVEFYG